jgi:5-methylcytosine-specific restriction endonuclease McrA
MKICCVCRTGKPLGAFGKSSREPDGLRPECKACRKAVYEANAQQLRAKQNAYYHANIEERRAAQRAYNLANADIIRAKGKARYAALTPDQRALLERQKAAWKARNPEKVRASMRAAFHNRRAAPGRFTAAQFQLMCRLYGNRCACCGAGGKLTPDHIIALARGGSNRIANIQPLCLTCNKRKWTKSIAYGFMPYYNPASMLADPAPWIAGDDSAHPLILQNGAVQPLLFSAEDAS